MKLSQRHCSLFVCLFDFWFVLICENAVAMLNMKFLYDDTLLQE